MNSNAQFPVDMKEFILRHHVFSISVSENDQPWSATCFYTFDTEDIRLIFVSETDTFHATLILHNNLVSGTISNNETDFTKIQGIQFTGIAEAAKNDTVKKYRKLFLKKFPFAFFKKLTLWSVRLDYVKMTDNTKHFAYKIHWKRNT